MKKIKALQKKILTWYQHHGRQLPWRTTTNPYHILVSEIMLQQTQVDRVIPYYPRFLTTFPTLQTLATAKKKQLLSNWSGLGYNHRALRLQQTAQAILEHHQGKLPADYEILITLPGIGPYTARALLAFAYNQDVPVIDTNIRRVIIHELHLPETIDKKKLEHYAQQLIPRGKSARWHNALMDYGALHLTVRTTGIKPLNKQTTFKGSTRQLRGMIIKKLLTKKYTVLQLQQELPDQRLLAVLTILEHEGFLTRNKKVVTIAKE